MTDLGYAAQFARAQTQPPVSAYFDEAILEHEKARIFRHSARYIGHEKMVPEVGDWYVAPHENGGRVLLRTESGVEYMSNVCRHRQAIMLGFNADRSKNWASGNTGTLRDTGGHIVCPIHRWTYDVQGTLIGAPLFDKKPCLALQKFPLKNCHGLLFEGPRDPAFDMRALFSTPAFDFSDYLLDHVEVHHCHYNWKTFIEVYLEDYHVGAFHPGLGRFVTCSDLTWQYGDWYSAQRVGIHAKLEHPGSECYRLWHEQLLAYRNGLPPEFGAIWVTYFPTHMIEVYPHVVVLSTLHPVTPQHTVNIVEFYYPEEIIAFESDFIQAQRAAYMETALEDDEIAERMDAGRLALLERGVNESGPYQAPLEDGMRHFHDWYQARMRNDHPDTSGPMKG